LKSLENAIESTIKAARWLLVVFYPASARLILYAVSFVYKFTKIAGSVFQLEKAR
jgi:uncharacterized membrane protein YqhA